MNHSVILIFLLAVLSYSASAQYFDPGVIHVLEEVPKALDYKNQICSTQLENIDNKSRDMNECVIALCGMPEQNKSSYLTNANFKDYFSLETQNKIELLNPQLNKLFNSIQKDKIKNLDEVKNLLIKNGQTKIDPTEWSSDFKKLLSYQVFSPFINTNVDYTKPFNSRFKINLKNTLKLDSNFKKNLESYASIYEQYVLKNNTKFQELGLYSNEEMKSIIKNRVKEIKDFIDNSKLDSPSKKEFGLKITRIEEESGANSDISIIFTMLDSLEDDLHETLPKFKKSPDSPSCENESCISIFKNYIDQQDIPAKIASLKKEIEDPKVKIDSLNRCKAQLIATIGREDNQKKADKLVEEVKAQMDKNVFSKFSTHSKTILQNYFAKKIHTVGSSASEVFGSVKSIDTLKKKISNFNLTVNTSSLSMVEEQALQKIISLNDEDLDPYNAEGSPCNSTITSNASDAFVSFSATMNKYDARKDYIKAKMPLTDLMFVSDFSCLYDIRGKSVAAHELGHAINQIFATQKLSKQSAEYYKSLRKCATDNYMVFSESTSEFLVQPGDGLKTEEDTADLFAYMTYPKSKDLFSCALIKPGVKNNTYALLEMLNSPDNQHSSPLYRLILEAVNKDIVLPVSCNKALAPYKEVLRIKKCI